MTADELLGCLIVNGTPGAGKSTASTLVARMLPRAARVKGDDVNEMILSGRVWFAGDPPEEAARQVELCHRNMCSLAANFVDFGFTVLMDTVVADRTELDFLVSLLAPRPVRLVTLAPGSAVCQRRNATRQHSERWEFAGYDRLHADMWQGFGNVGLVVRHLSSHASGNRPAHRPRCDPLRHPDIDGSLLPGGSGRCRPPRSRL